MVGGKVDGQILFGARVRNGKIYLVPNDSYEKMYLAVKGLNRMFCYHRTPQLTKTIQLQLIEMGKVAKSPVIHFSLIRSRIMSSLK